MAKNTMVTLALAGLGALGLAATSALAMPAAPQAQVEPAPLLQLADVNVNVQVWNRKRHGNRCWRRHGGCQYYYQGWWYQQPWWYYAPPRPIYLQPRPNYRSLHTDWCYARYRSYDRRTNTWISYSGHVRQCISPYL
jgi:BA14K-like protein